MTKEYDYLIVGSGFFGAVFARLMTDAGKKVLVIDKRSHIGGNCYTQNIDSINVHKYGPHIFHTSDNSIWNFVSKYAEFNHFSYRPKVSYKNKLYSFPINLMSLYQVYGVKTPEEARQKLDEVKIPIENPSNLEEWILSQVGPELYEIFIKGYTAKQWNRPPKDLPASIVRRIPIRLVYDDNYYNDTYQGIPIGGYTAMFQNLFKGIEINLETDFFLNKEHFYQISDKIVYTGPVDMFFDYRFGKLEYRSLRFETNNLELRDYQGIAGVNYSDIEIPFTRIIEHKHFEFGMQKNTIITKEYPATGGEPFYPINDTINNDRYSQYKKLMKNEHNVIFGGRLADYKYYDMHQVIASAIHASKLELQKIN